jgi:hypothetical protein
MFYFGISTASRCSPRLSSILDVVGYSRLMEIDEVGTLTALRAVRRDLVDPRIAEQPRPYPIPRGLSMIMER